MERARLLTLGARVSGLVALLGAVGLLTSDGPYLGGDGGGFSPWAIAWALGLFGLLLFAPFALHRRIAVRTEDRDRRWDLAIVAWGGAALAGLAAFGALGLLSGGLGGDEALGAMALIAVLECALVVVAVLVLVLSTG